MLTVCVFYEMTDGSFFFAHYGEIRCGQMATEKFLDFLQQQVMKILRDYPVREYKKKRFTLSYTKKCSLKVIFIHIVQNCKIFSLLYSKCF